MTKTEWEREMAEHLSEQTLGYVQLYFSRITEKDMEKLGARLCKILKAKDAMAR